MSVDPSHACRLAVTGITGLLGCALAREACGRYDVWGLARHPEAAHLQCHTMSVDVMDKSAVARAIATIAPDVVIHSAALSSVDLCETDPALATAVNVDGTQHLLDALRGHRCRFILISTDSVFDGTRGHYTENDKPAPLNVYARTKLKAEERVLESRYDALVVRTNFYGWNILPKASLSEWILSRLRTGYEVSGFQDIFFSPLMSNQLARLLLELVPNPVEGVLHVASAEGCSKYEFARRLAAVFGLPTSQVIAATSEAVCLVAPRPKNLTLAVARAATVLGRRLPSIDEGLVEFLRLESTMKACNVTSDAMKQ